MYAQSGGLRSYRDRPWALATLVHSQPVLSSVGTHIVHRSHNALEQVGLGDWGLAQSISSTRPGRRLSGVSIVAGSYICHQSCSRGVSRYVEYPHCVTADPEAALQKDPAPQ